MESQNKTSRESRKGIKKTVSIEGNHTWMVSDRNSFTETSPASLVSEQESNKLVLSVRIVTVFSHLE